MSDRVRTLLAEAMSLSAEERADLVEELIALAPEASWDAETVRELERRARRAREQPDGGEAWDAVRERLCARHA